MTNFITANKTYVKSTNSIKKINITYLYTLITFTIYYFIYYLFLKDYSHIIASSKSLLVLLITAIIFEYLSRLIDKSSSSSSSLLNTLSISLIIFLLTNHLNILVSLISLLISLIIKKTTKNSFLSSTLYGLLFALIYQYATNTPSILPILIEESSKGFLKFLLMPPISPIISLASLFYLFHKKVLKYPLVFSYFLTYLLVILSYNLLKGTEIFQILNILISNNILFLSIYCLADSYKSPTIFEGELIYGIILGLITSILSLIIPELAAIITIIIGLFIFVKPLDKLSIKLKYQENTFSKTIYVLVFLSLLTITALYFIF